MEGLSSPPLSLFEGGDQSQLMRDSEVQCSDKQVPRSGRCRDSHDIHDSQKWEMKKPLVLYLDRW